MLWHNPKCSKSQAVAAILADLGVAHTVRKYLEEPPSMKELETLSRLLGTHPIHWVRRSEPEFDETGMGSGAEPETSRVLEAIARHPILLERPILVDDRSGIVARPPEKATEWLREQGHVGE